MAESLIAGGANVGALYLSAAHSLKEARDFLMKGEDLNRDEAIWHYRLACYDCHLGDLEAAKARLARAFEIEPAMRHRALQEADLEPLWGSSAVGLGDERRKD